MATKIEIEVTDPVGLYASPVTELVNKVKTFQSHLTLRYQNKDVNLKSMMGVLSLGIPTHAILEVLIDGPDEEQAKQAVIDKITELSIGIVKQ